MMKTCMNWNKRLILSIFWILFGLTLVLCSYAQMLDSFWCGLGTGLLVVGILQLIRNLRYRTNPSYQEAVDTACQDERNHFLAGKAWAWAGYLFVIIAAVFTVFFYLSDRRELMMLTSWGICLMVFLYWVSYMILRKKY